MNWKYIKWLSRQPGVRFVRRKHSLWWGGLYDSCEIRLRGKEMYSFYIHPEKSSDGFRADWIERL